MRRRLDQVLVDRGLAESRARARGLILRGLVSVDGRSAEKPGQLVDDETGIALRDEAPGYVSFGGDKLAFGLENFGEAYDPAGRVALDVGASTGGFTDVLLRRGARRVYAVDVGHGQLHPRVAADPRVIVLENTDARALSPALIPDAVEAIVADVSFVSLTKVLAPALQLAAPGAWLIALVKPQFEAGRDAIGKGGIVRDAAERQRALDAVRRWLGGQPGWRLGPVASWSGLPGTNEEFLIGAVSDA